jgi:hypothetical protein
VGGHVVVAALGKAQDTGSAIVGVLGERGHTRDVVVVAEGDLLGEQRRALGDAAEADQVLAGGVDDRCRVAVAEGHGVIARRLDGELI